MWLVPWGWGVCALLAMRVGGETVRGPNFLVVVADDLRADAVGVYGGREAGTPVLDRLAGQGCHFRQACCFGSNSGAVCVPSRAMLMAGRTFFEVGGELKGVRTLPERLEARGYQTFLAGKWHNGKESCERSFADGEAVFLGGMTDQFHPMLGAVRGHRLGDMARSEAFSTDAIGAAAVKFLGNRDRSRPFFAWVAFTVPHDPRTPKPVAEAPPVVPGGAASPWLSRVDVPYSELHSREDQRLPANFLPQHPFDNGWLTVRDEELLGWPRDPAEVRREWASYRGLVSHMDARIGDILLALEAAGDAGTTYVIFLSDHGLALGSHGLLGKQSLYEHSMRAPLMVRGPGVEAGRRSEELVYLHDVHATVLDLAGEPTEARRETDSRSLVPLWQAGSAAAGLGRDRVLLAFTDTMRAVRSGPWKLIRYPKVDVTQLFHLGDDPDERNDLSVAEPDQVTAMRGLLDEAQRAAGDTLPWTAEVRRPAAVDLTARPRDPYAGRPWARPAR